MSMSNVNAYAVSSVPSGVDAVTVIENVPAKSELLPSSVNWLSIVLNDIAVESTPATETVGIVAA